MRDTILDYIDDIRAHPEKYCTLKDIVLTANDRSIIFKAPTMPALKTAFNDAIRRAKERGDKDGLKYLIEAKNDRKKQLEGFTKPLQHSRGSISNV